MGDKEVLIADGVGGNEGDFNFLAAQPNAGAIAAVVKEAILFYETEPYDAAFGPKGVPLAQLSISAHQVMVNIRSHLSQQLSNEGLTGDQATKYTDEVIAAVDQLRNRGVTPTVDPRGDILGRRSLERAAHKLGQIDTLYSGSPFIYEPDRSKGGIHGVDLAFDIATVEATPYDHKRIIIVGSQPGIMFAGTLAFQRNPDQSSLVLWDRDQQRFITMAGEKREVTENSKIILTAHGSYLKVGKLGASEIADIIAEVVPGGGRVKKIRIDSCSVEKFSYFIDPKLGAASQATLEGNFGGSLLRALEKKSISAGVVVTNNKDALTDNFLGNRYVFLMGSERKQPYIEITLKKAH